MPWVSDDGTTASDRKKKKGEDDLIDLSLLRANGDQGDFDSPVTSGADPASWDPIGIDQIPH